MKLFDYQKKAVSFIREHKRTYLALDMGMGKSLTSLASLEEGNILLIAEKNEIVNSQNFKKEIHGNFLDMDYYNLRDESIDISSYEKTSKRFVGGINPDGIEKVPDDILNQINAVIIDEATLAKTTTTQRFKKVKKIVEQVDHLVLLSGTPMMNGASELYAPLILMDNPLVAGKGAKGKKAFEAVFAGGNYKQIRALPLGWTMYDAYKRGQSWKYYTWWAKGANNLRVLRYLLRDSFFIMSKEETKVFKNKTRKMKFVEMDFEWVAEYSRAWDEYLQVAKERKVNMENVVELRNLIENGQCYQVNSRRKAKIVAEDIANGLYGDERIIVFSKFIETDRVLQNELENLGVSFKTFDELQEWKDGDEQVLIGKIGSHNKGGNVPEASVCLFVDMDFVPSNNIQAENRIDRPEQKKDMTIVYYMTQGKDIVDHHVRNINRDKASKIKNFMKPLTQDEIDNMPEEISRLRIKFPKELEILGI